MLLDSCDLIVSSRTSYLCDQLVAQYCLSLIHKAIGVDSAATLPELLDRENFWLLIHL